MRKIITLLLLAVIAVSCQEEEKKTVKVACIGDSITFGSGVVNREKNSFPVKLGVLLGEGYDVQNFGVSGTTLLLKGDIPYIKTDRFKAMMEFQPDVVFIKLGTNDSKIQNRAHIKDFKSDYETLLDSIYKVSPECRVVALTPVKAHNYPDTIGITADYISNVIVGEVQKVAFDNNLEVINLHPMFYNYVEHEMPDKVHPSSNGAAKIAFRLYEHLVKSSTDFKFDHQFKDTTNFYGYNCYTFDFEGKSSIVVAPKKSADGNPWVMRARFWGHEPQTDISLLERGFHILYNDVADMFGSPAAVAQWEKFYDFATSKGLNKKMAIEGMSRGGLIAYNFAAKNPEKVAIVYADAPVLDFKSWPMNNKHGKEVVPALLKAYGFESEQEAMNYVGNPIDKCEQIAKGGFEMIHVCGEADDVVPISENSTPFIQKLKDLDADVKYIGKPEVGHHPHSLKNPEQITIAILRATGHYLSPTTIPVPGSEYRSAAGWTNGNDWHSVSEEISELCAADTLEMLLLGNSITQGFGGERTRTSQYKPGKVYIDSILSNKKWVSAGISGDRTQQLLYRINTGGYEKGNPKYTVIAIGINNLGTGVDNATETVDGIKLCVKAVRERMKDTKIILFGALPAQRHMKSCIEISELLKEWTWDENTVYVDPFPVFAPDKQNIIKDYYTGDELHLVGAGFKVWAEEIAKYL